MSPRHTLCNSYGIVETDVAFVAGVVTKDFGRACGSPIVEVDDAGPPGGVVGVVVAVGIMPVGPFDPARGIRRSGCGPYKERPSLS
jgi:hypothetical protein